ncbi:MAG TPA: hypothetical protein VGQ09_12430 [Chitinophagaceae bacterium]|jgi:hypothetical protein|nr:hypothetical protein [Chitinophagaceae bacterium]
MERNFNNEFERFLKENADQYRLYPSTKVWKGVYTALHTRRKWFGLGITLLLITGALVTLLITNSSKQAIIPINKPAIEKQQVSVPDVKLYPEDKKVSSHKFQRNRLNPVSINNRSSISATRFYHDPLNNVIGINQNNFYNDIFTNSSAPFTFNITDELTDQDVFNITSTPKIADVPQKSVKSNLFDWTIESVLNSFTPLTKRNKRFSFQVNFTPTISYRKLSENKSFLRSAASQSNTTPTYTPLYDINSVVTHKPDMGLEFGFTTKYSLANNFKVKGGLQFNINRYDIKAFNYPLEVARIALRGNAGVDSFYTISTHRNFGGYKSDWLQNFYFEISMPVGIEVNLIGDEKVQFGVAGTIQPTYVLGDRAYLLSTDYKNYAEVPWLIRRWNASTALETFVSYSTGRMKWQVGPQVRYQLLSSFVDKYPVKENLFDFGLKVGISLNK